MGDIKCYCSLTDIMAQDDAAINLYTSTPNGNGIRSYCDLVGAIEALRCSLEQHVDFHRASGRHQAQSFVLFHEHPQSTSSLFENGSQIRRSFQMGLRVSIHGDPLLSIDVRSPKTSIRLHHQVRHTSHHYSRRVGSNGTRTDAHTGDSQRVARSESQNQIDQKREVSQDMRDGEGLNTIGYGIGIFLALCTQIRAMSLFPGIMVEIM